MKGKPPTALLVRKKPSKTMPEFNELIFRLEFRFFGRCCPFSIHQVHDVADLHTYHLISAENRSSVL